MKIASPLKARCIVTSFSESEKEKQIERALVLTLFENKLVAYLICRLFLFEFFVENSQQI